MKRFRIVEMEGGTYSLEVFLGDDWMIFSESSPENICNLIDRMGRFMSFSVEKDGVKFVHKSPKLPKTTSHVRSGGSTLESQRMFSFPDWQW